MTVVECSLTLNKGQHTKLTLEKKIPLPLLQGFKLATFGHKSGTLTNELSLLPILLIILITDNPVMLGFLCVIETEQVHDTAVLGFSL